jgi:hypothetical protein
MVNSPWHELNNNMKIYFTETGCEHVIWTNLPNSILTRWLQWIVMLHYGKFWSIWRIKNCWLVMKLWMHTPYQLWARPTTIGIWYEDSFVSKFPPMQLWNCILSILQRRHFHMSRIVAIWLYKHRYMKNLQSEEHVACWSTSSLQLNRIWLQLSLCMYNLGKSIVVVK